MSDTTEFPADSSCIKDWNTSANFESPYSEKIQRLHALFDKARVSGSYNYLYVLINDAGNLEHTTLPLSSITNEPYKAKDAERLFPLNTKTNKNWKFILSMDLRETFDKQIRSTGINPEQPVSWEFLRAHPINCLDKTLLLEHKKPAGYIPHLSKLSKI